MHTCIRTLPRMHTRTRARVHATPGKEALQKIVVSVQGWGGRGKRGGREPTGKGCYALKCSKVAVMLHVSVLINTTGGALLHAPFSNHFVQLLIASYVMRCTCVWRQRCAEVERRCDPA